jgi:ATP-dependent RNA helicase DDX31/DBP7
MAAAAAAAAAAANAPSGSAHVAASSGVVRGHLRDGFGLTRPTRVQRGMIPLALAGRSLVVKSETGSGKTLSFVLPIVQGLLPPAASASAPSSSTAAAIAASRAEGTRALIISPTRELCAQIYSVVARVCQPFPYIVPCLLAGGEKRKSEKARLRKGATVVVATPGRLLDHLRTTESFSCSASTLRWLVLDEADRLLDMGFGAQVRDIVAALKRRAGAGGGHAGGSPGAATSPSTFLLSATASPAVQELAQDVLFADAAFLDASGGAGGGLVAEPLPKVAEVKGSKGETAAARDDEEDGDEDDEDGSDADGSDTDSDADAPAKPAPAITYTAPKQLQQTAMVVPLKWRLVTLVALLYQAVVRGRARAAAISRKAVASVAAASAAGLPTGPVLSAEAADAGCKAILFVSTTDSADFHHVLLASVLARLLGSGRNGGQPFPVYRLHGNVPQSERTSVFRAFAASTSSLLVATDVAARGLDLPAVDLILQADAPSETQDYVHRIGRTARRGQRGSAILLLQPHEQPYLDLLRAAGLDLELADTVTALATLADAHMPLDLVSASAPALAPGAHSSAQQQGAGGAAAAAGGKRGRDGGKGGKGGDAGKGGDVATSLFGGMLGMSVKDAEAAAAATVRLGAANAAAANGQGQRDRRGGGAATGHGGEAADPAERDPSTGVSSRLLRLRDFARKLKSPHGGASSSGAQGSSSSSSGGPPTLARLAEAHAVSWQCWLEELVLMSGGRSGGGGLTVDLLPLGRDAFLSFVRAYSTHEKAVRHIFHPRTLHLGHAAKAFGLREQPTAASRTAKRENEVSAAAATAMASSAMVTDAPSAIQIARERGGEDEDDGDDNEGGENGRRAADPRGRAAAFAEPDGPSDLEDEDGGMAGGRRAAPGGGARWQQQQAVRRGAAIPVAPGRKGLGAGRGGARAGPGGRGGGGGGGGSDAHASSRLHFGRESGGEGSDSEDDRGRTRKMRRRAAAAGMGEFDA